MKKILAPPLDEEHRYFAARVLNDSAKIDWNSAQAVISRTPGTVFVSEDQELVNRIATELQAIGIPVEILDATTLDKTIFERAQASVLADSLVNLGQATKASIQKARATWERSGTVHDLQAPGPQVDRRTNNEIRLSQRQLIAFLGSGLLFIGVFMPLIRIPIAGSLNYFQNGRGDGIIILTLAVAAAIFAFQRKYQRVKWAGFASLGVLLLTFVLLNMRLSQARAELERDLAGNPFKGLGEAALQSVQMQIGWAVLTAGGLLLLLAGLLSRTIRIDMSEK